MESSLAGVLVRLKVVAQIPVEGKLRKIDADHFTVESCNVFTPLRRYWEGCTRGVCITMLNGLAFDIERLLTNKQHLSPAALDSFMEQLEASRAGLNNLKFTYRHDAHTVAHIEVISDKFKLWINNDFRRQKREMNNNNAK